MTLKELIYPPRCPFCGELRMEQGPCDVCLKNTTELTAITCRVCGAYPEDCHCGQRAYAFQRNVSAFAYTGAPRTLLLRYKQRYKPQLADFMTRRMYAHIKARLGEAFDAVAYVPQTRKSSYDRGYYPTRILAEKLADRLGLPCVHPLKRTAGMEQKDVRTSADRWANARRSYALRRGAKIEGRILLIDDLFTTGATLNTCAELLRQGGAEEVFCATFAIAVKKS